MTAPEMATEGLLIVWCEMSVEAASFLDKKQAIKLSVGSSQLPHSALHPSLDSWLESESDNLRSGEVIPWSDVG